VSEQLVETILVLEDAARIRAARLKDPMPDPDANTEEDVVAALLARGYEPGQALHLRRWFTRALRLMIRGLVDRQG
jgi:hypothetical protein